MKFIVVFTPPPDDGWARVGTLVGIVAGLVTIAQAFEQPKRRRRYYR